MIKRPTLEQLRALVAESEKSCRCDGGNTMGCSACVATRKLRGMDVAEQTIAKRFTTHPIHRESKPKPPLGPVRNLWQEAVEEACIVRHLDFTPEDPKKTLQNLIQWEVKCALDPVVVSEAANALLTRYLVGERKLCPHKYEIVPSDVWPRCPVCQPEISDEKFLAVIRETLQDDLEELVLDGELKRAKHKDPDLCSHCGGRGPLRHNAHPTRHGKIAHVGEGGPLPYER